MNRILVLTLVFVFLFSGCSAPVGEGMEVRDAWARPTAQGENGAVYFVIRSSSADEIVGASSDVAEAVEIHESAMNGDVMEMHHSPSVPLGAGEEVTFDPGGLHIMLVRLKQELKAGDEIEVALHFKKHKDLKLNVVVRDDPASQENQGSEIEQNKQKWQDANVSRYRFHLNIGCFCVFSQDMPLLIEVQNGEVVSMEYQSGNEIDAANREYFQRFATIDKLFAEIENGFQTGDSSDSSQNKADEVAVEYDETYGFPTQVNVDFIKNAVDDELSLTLSNFEKLP